MANILDYILANYVWFLVGTIIILLAVIGYYAEKTNFGLGKKASVEPEKKEIPLPDKKLQDILTSTELEDPLKPIEEKTKNEVPLEPTIDLNESAPIQQLDTNTSSINEQAEKLNEEFSKVVPEKPIISDDLIDDIDSLSIESASSKKTIDIPDLDDVDLPKIRSLSSNKEDIWKF